LEREKIVRKIGDSIGIIFNKEESIVLNLYVGKKVKVALHSLEEESKNDG